jgi:hypothetical protein
VVAGEDDRNAQWPTSAFVEPCRVRERPIELESRSELVVGRLGSGEAVNPLVRDRSRVQGHAIDEAAYAWPLVPLHEQFGKLARRLELKVSEHRHGLDLRPRIEPGRGISRLTTPRVSSGNWRASATMPPMSWAAIYAGSGPTGSAVGLMSRAKLAAPYPEAAASDPPRRAGRQPLRYTCAPVSA